MAFVQAREILGEASEVRTVNVIQHAQLPDGDYTFFDMYCTDADCDCRKTMLHVRHNNRHVSTINFGWETAAFYQTWYGSPLDAQTLAEMKGPSIDLTSPDVVSPDGMLDFFTTIADEYYKNHVRNQYVRFRKAILTSGGSRRAAEVMDSVNRAPSRVPNRNRNLPCPCGSGRKFKVCCGRTR